MKLIRTIILISSLLSSLMARAERENIFPDAFSIATVDMKDGLPHNFIEDMFQDSEGFMWISTPTGLSRYDGYEFVTFTPNSLTHNIKSAFPQKAEEDGFGRLWVASEGGIDVINLADLSSTLPKDNTGYLEKTLSTPATYLCKDSGGNMWVRTNTDIICISFNSDGDVSGFTSIPHNTTSVVTTTPVKTLHGEAGVLTGIGGYPSRLTLADGKIKVTHLSDKLSVHPSVYIADFAATGTHLWVATGIGLYSLDKKSGEIHLYDSFPGVEANLSQNFVTSIVILPDGSLLAGGLNGLNIQDPATDSFRHIDLNDLRQQPRLLNNNFINCILLEDDSLWIGTEGCGIDIFSPRKILARTLHNDPKDPLSISPNCVNAIFEDGDGTLWIGTVEGGLNKGINGYGNGFIHYTRESGTLPHNSVSAITADHTGHLWVGTWGGGVCVLERRNPGKPLKVINETPDGGVLHHIGTLAYDPFNNAVWIGVNSGIYLYDIDSEKLSVPFEGSDKFRGNVASVVAPDGTLWIGGSDGLISVDLKHAKDKGGYRHTFYRHKLDSPEISAVEKITALALGKDGSLWIGTNGNGVYHREAEEGETRFVNYSTADGLPNDVIHGLAEDTHGNLWIATYHGLSCMNKERRFINFDRSNGLDTEQFHWNAYKALSNGDLLFGSVDGLLAVKGLVSPDSEPGHHVNFTSLAVNNDTVYGNLRYANIPESERSFEIGFSALDFGGARTGRYLYRMAGYDNDWKELPPGRHSVAYMNLFPGKYNLEVKYVADGQDPTISPVSRFEVEIIPNFYRRWWFVALIILLLIGIVVSVYMWRISDLKRQRNELKAAVEEGVREISEQKAQVQQLTADRIAFFTNITHEFRTPITLIIGPIERALKLSTNPKVIEQLNYVERNSRYLLSLVNQLMDFRKIESGKVEAVTTRGDIRRFVEEIVGPFRAYADERNICIRTLFHLPAPIVTYNEDSMRKVLTNLLGNAIKFTPDGGKVTVYTALIRESLYICVSDTGCGIDEEETDKVFGYFYQGKSQIKYPLIGAADSGIGLYLCRKLVEVYGGKIWARNNRESGCSFRVMLPAECFPAEAPASDAPDDEQLPSQEEETEKRRPGLLLVEDNPDMRAFMRSVLSESFNVTTASNGAEAIRFLLAHDDETDIIISDLMMPVMDGLELASKVKENFAISHIPFIMLTAKTSEEARMEGYRRGVDDYILKPFDEEMLLTRIHNIMENRRRMQRHFLSEMKVEDLAIKEESRDKKFIDKVMEVIRDNYSNSYYELNEMAEALGVSASLLNRKLNSLLGQTAMQLLRGYRMKIARELINKNRKNQDASISEIAFKVGFNDPKYFSKCFTKEFGVSPSTMMKQES